MDNRPASNANWLYDSPVHSDVEAKLRRFLVELGNADKILGIQVCAYKDGEVIIDTAAVVLKKDDPRPVKPDSLFPLFSATKGITTGMIHWLADKGKLKLDDYYTLQTFGQRLVQTEKIKVSKTCCLAAPETEPGREPLYHYLSYGWLCGGIIQHASGKKFQDVLDEAFVRPLNIESEFYIGIPPGAESRLATLTAIDTNELISFGQLLESSTFVPSSFNVDMISSIIPISNTLDVRRAIIPAANGHCSARALARYYATLADGGVVPPLDKKASAMNPEADLIINTKIFTNSKEEIHDAFLGSGDYKDLVFPNGLYGLGFRRVNTSDGSVIGFGQAGLGGSVGYCDIYNRFAISVTLNKLSIGDFTGNIIRFVCLELDIPVPEAGIGKSMLTEKPVIN